MCDVESYSYLPMLEDLGYIPKNRYAFGDEILGHFEAIAAKYDLVADALFHTRVDRTEWDAGSSRWILRTDHGDEITAKYADAPLLPCDVTRPEQLDELFSRLENEMGKLPITL